MELLKVSKDKRALKFIKKRVGRAPVRDPVWDSGLRLTALLPGRWGHTSARRGRERS